MLEACYAVTDEALLSLYRWVNWFFGTFIGPMVIFWMKVFYRNRLKDVDPVALAPQVKAPTLIIHGENDRRFPVEFARRLHASFPEGQAQLTVWANLSTGMPAISAAIRARLTPFPACRQLAKTVICGMIASWIFINVANALPENLGKVKSRNLP